MGDPLLKTKWAEGAWDHSEREEGLWMVVDGGDPITSQLFCKEWCNIVGFSTFWRGKFS